VTLTKTRRGLGRSKRDNNENREKRTFFKGGKRREIVEFRGKKVSAKKEKKGSWKKDARENHDLCVISEKEEKFVP